MSKINETLIELIVKSIVELKERKRSKNRTKGHKIPNLKNSIAAGIANVVNNNIKLGKNKKRKENKEESNLEDAADEADVSKEKARPGGYGTIKPYSGMSPYVQYSDYSKIWSHIGAFKAYSMFGNSEDMTATAMRNGESSREMISERTQTMAARSFKYFARTATMEAHTDYFTVTSLVPPTGANIDSKEWEKYALMMKMSVYQPIIRLNARMA